MMRFFLTMAFAMATALPALAQQPLRPREGDDVAKLRAEVRDLEEKLKEAALPKKKDSKPESKKEEPQGDKKPEARKEEPKGPPMGGGFPGGFNPMGGGFPRSSGFGPMSGGGRGEGHESPDFSKMPGFDKLSQEEKRMLANLVQKMRTPVPAPAETLGGNSVEARLDRLEKAIGELANSLKNQSAPRTPPGAGGGGFPGGGPRGGGR